MSNLKYKTFDEFISDITLPSGKLFCLWEKSKFIYRGESSLTYKLLPSALREDGHTQVWHLSNLKMTGTESEYSQISGEIQALTTFFNKCDENGLYIPNIDILNENFFSELIYELHFTNGKWLFPELYELAGLAQHYGVPTRLLDWTKDIWVALYFACVGALKGNFDKDDCVVI